MMNEMCETIEKYAKDRALDAAIIVGSRHCTSKELLICDTMKQFPELPEESVISRIEYFGNP